MNVAAVLSVTLILFSVIDMIGNIPIIINMKREGLRINAQTTTVVSGSIMISFLFFGSAILGLFGIDIAHIPFSCGSLFFRGFTSRSMSEFRRGPVTLVELRREPEIDTEMTGGFTGSSFVVSTTSSDKDEALISHSKGGRSIN